MVVANDPMVLYYPLAPASTRGSAGLVYDFVSPGLTLYDDTGRLRPILIDQVPSLDNGLWQLLPDGRMETTWRLRPGATWHDGAPFTADDLRFTLQVVQDSALPAFANQTYSFIESATVMDPQTLVLDWNRPYIDADRAFTYLGTASFAVPMPKHLLEASYTANKAGFLDQPYWSSAYVGLGPYKLDQWTPGSSMTLRAFDDYVLGRPKIDEVDIHFISDPDAIVSNFLAGAADVFSGAAIGVDEGLELRDRWTDGTTNVIRFDWVAIYPQFVDPQPAVVGNVHLRKALMYAIDRQAMADTLMHGLVPIADSPLDPDAREFAPTAASLVTYPYDPTRAIQLISDLGYTRGADGTFHDGAGQPLAVEVRGASSRAIQVKPLFPVAADWQQVGVAATPTVISAQQASDIKDQATFQAFQLVRQDYGLNRLISYTSSEARLPARNYTGSNNGRYMSPELDALIGRYLVTVPWDERMQVAGQILHQVTEQLAVMPLFYDMEIGLVSHRVQHATPLLAPTDSRAWNAQEWDIA